MELRDLPENIIADIKAVNSLSMVPLILNVICRTTGMGFAAIARVTDTKWITCRVQDDISFGLKTGDELKLETTICNEIRQTHTAVVIDHVAQDALFCNHHTALQYEFQSYISEPIIKKDGTFFGTLCAIDPNPVRLNRPEITGMFKLFADLISLHLHTVEELLISEARLEEEKKLNELKDQFLAILGHDLRNPLAAISMGAHLLEDLTISDDGQLVVKTIKNSTYRMGVLVNNMLDFTRGNLGEGIELNMEEYEDVKGIIQQVIGELQTVYPDRIFITEINLVRGLNCDTSRLSQLFSNLIGNAVVHGLAKEPIEIIAHQKNGFHFSVSNSGKQITEDEIEKLFKPFYRGQDRSGKNGLGLGLYIASEIARAHKGSLTVSSTPAKTCFEFYMP